MRRTAALLALLGAACAPAASPRPAASLEAEVRSIIARAAGDTAEVAVAFRDLATGDSLLLDARKTMHAASTMKVPVMLELFRRADAGELRMADSVAVRNEFRSIADGSTYTLSSGDDGDPTLYARVGQRIPVRELVERMIVRSSNLATNLLIDRADPKRIAATLDGLGAGELKVLRGVEDVCTACRRRPLSPSSREKSSRVRSRPLNRASITRSP